MYYASEFVAPNPLQTLWNTLGELVECGRRMLRQLWRTGRRI